MTPRFPQRPESHQLEDESENFFRQSLPAGWICDRPNNDYGVDLVVSLANEGQITGRELIVQLKASQRSASRDYVVIRLRVTTLHLLREKLAVAMLVKYVREEREAYWLLLKDFTEHPGPNQRSISIRIPKSNALSRGPWQSVIQHVNAVHSRKLNANTPGRPG